MGYDSTVLATSPKLFLKLDETSGTTAADSSGNGYTATHNGTYTLGQPPLLADGSGKSIKYNGGYTSVTPVSTLNSPVISINMRIAATAANGAGTGTQVLAARWSGVSGYVWLLTLENGVPRLTFTLQAFGSNIVVDAAAALVPGQLYTIGTTYDGATARLFVNGSQAGFVDFAGAMRQTDTEFEIARAAAAVYGNVQVDGFAYWTRALTSTEVANIHAAATSTAVTLAIGQVVETDTARGPLTLGALPIGQALESDVANPIPPATTPSAAIPIGTAVESDVTRAFALPGAILIGTATETDVARAGITSPIAIGRAESYDAARPVEVAPAVTAPARPYGMSKVKALAYPTPDLIDGRVA